MQAQEGTAEADVVVDRLESATNRHDVDAMVACFAPDYRNETPAHPARGFVGREQVRANWERILRSVPQLTARVLRKAVSGNVVWSEWEQSGVRLDGSAFAMAGVIIFGVTEGRIGWARFYLEPVSDGGDVEQAVRELAERSAPSGTERS